DMVIMKFDQGGNQQWSKDYGGTYREAIFGVSQDALGNPHCTGIFYGTVNFGIQTIVEADYSTQNPAGNGDAFVMKLSAADGSCIWVRHIRGSVNNNEVGQAISTDPGFSSYVTGTINGSGAQFAIFGSNANQTGTNINPTNGNDCFVAKYDINGTLLWVIKTGGSNSERGQSILWDATGYVNVAGNFSGQITLGANTLTAPSQAAVFVARYNGLTTGIGTIENDPSLVVFPNPARDFIRLSSEERLIDGVEIYNLNGALIIQERFPFGSNSLELNVGNLSQGQYLLHVISGEKRSIQQIQVR
ncbi:MAG: T9SS type A sorting domain-containing protein, partial [Bacteroidota bacterium]